MALVRRIFWERDGWIYLRKTDTQNLDGILFTLRSMNGAEVYKIGRREESHERTK